MALPKSVRDLIDDFIKLPGIGPRQAARFAYALFEKDPAFIQNFARHLESIKTETASCSQCFRVTEKRPFGRCDICESPSRLAHKILVVEKDQDLESFEKAGIFNGVYHVLGGSISSLEKNSAERLRMRELFERVKILKAQGLEDVEVIIATSNTVEGNQTANYIDRILEPLKPAITRLGRGLSTGSEIEYADPLTLEQALKNRK